jgi:hypothetical protein
MLWSRCAGVTDEALLMQALLMQALAMPACAVQRQFSPRSSAVRRRAPEATDPLKVGAASSLLPAPLLFD